MPDPSPAPTSPPPRSRFREMMGKNVKALSLVPREQRFYDFFEHQAAILVSASGLLKEALNDMENLPVRQREIKDLEHLGDKNTYETMRTLNETFVTPSITRTSLRLRPVSTTYSTTSKRSPTR